MAADYDSLLGTPSSNSLSLDSSAFKAVIRGQKNSAFRWLEHVLQREIFFVAGILLLYFNKLLITFPALLPGSDYIIVLFICTPAASSPAGPYSTRLKLELQLH